MVDARCVQSGDGGRRCFARPGEGPLPGPAAFEGTREWRLIFIEDAYGNRVEVSLLSTGGSWVWEFVDDHDRIYRVNHEPWGEGPYLSPYTKVTSVELPGVAGSTVEYSFTYNDGSPDPVEVPRGPGNNLPGFPTAPAYLLTRIDLPDGTSYEFDYCLNNTESCNGGGLKEARLRTGGRIRWTYGIYIHPSSQICAPHPSPPHIDPQGEWEIPLHSHFGGIVQRETVDPAGSVVGRWTYLNRLRPTWGETGPAPAPGPGPLPGSGGVLCANPPRELESTLIDPHGNRTVRYFSMYVYDPELQGSGNNPDGWTRAEYGLPFTRRWRYAGAAGELDDLFLSERVLTCDDALREVHGVPGENPTAPNPQTNPANCRLETLRYVRYQQDAAIAPYCEDDGETKPECGDRNSRLARERIEHYYQAANQTGNTYLPEESTLAHHKTVVRSGWDTYGHYRDTSITGTRLQGTRLEHVRYQPPAQPTAAQWVLGTFDFSWVQEGSRREWVDTDFDSATGFLRCQRILEKTSTGVLPPVSPRDLSICYAGETGNASSCAPGNGNVALIRWIGGDLSPTTGACGDSEEYRIEREFEHGVLAKSSFVDPLQPSRRLVRVDHTLIDENTGLVLRTRDAAGVSLGIEYFNDGRRKRIEPQGEAATEVCYEPWGSGGCPRPRTNAQVVVSRVAGSNVLTREWVEYDALGRVVASSHLMPGNADNGPTSHQLMTYDAGGRLKAASTPFAGNPRGWTQHQGYDALGRPAKVVAPDGEESTYAYFGPGEHDKTARVFAPGATWDLYHERHLTDALGRLVEVRDESDPHSAGSASTTYAHDPKQRLIEVRQSAVAPPSGGLAVNQTRTFHYDGRGFLLSEKHPELGVNGNGSIVYGDYDSRGNPGFKRFTGGGEVELRFHYDFAGRLIATTRADGTPLVEIFYGHANAGSDLRAGKLVMSKRHNPAGTITHTFFYNRPDGKLSEQTTRNWDGTDGALRFVQKFQYDLLGNLQRIDYPDCRRVSSPGEAIPEDCPAPSVAPQRAAVSAYDRGLLADLDAITGAAGTLAVVNEVDYDPNGMMTLVARANGTSDEVAVDPTGMPRPLRMRSLHNQQHFFNSGCIRYDGLGSPFQMNRYAGDCPTSLPWPAPLSADAFKYDTAGRLVEAALTSASPSTEGVIQKYAYDRFGNLTGISTSYTPASNPSLFLGRGFEVDSRYNRLLRRCTVENAATCGNQQPAPPVSGGAPQMLYDVQGNVAAIGSGVTGYSFGYGPAGLLEQIQGLGINRSHLYDADGERVLTLDEMLYDGAGGKVWTLRGPGKQVLRELVLPKSSGQPRLTDYFHAGGKLMASTSAASPTGLNHFHLDHLGSVRAVTGPGGAVVAQHKYLPFGEEMPGSAANDLDRMRFAGHERDGHTPVSGTADGKHDDLDYMHARYYSPWVGRFLSVDSILGKVSEPQSWNRYGYVSNSPLRLIDPNGRDEKDPNETVEEVAQATTTFVIERAVEHQLARGGGSVPERCKLVVESMDFRRPSVADRGNATARL